jgi:hypothetical protein
MMGNPEVISWPIGLVPRNAFVLTGLAIFRVVDITGQSLPILAPLLTIDVLWSDLQMVHQDRSLMSYDSFYWTFRTA